MALSLALVLHVVWLYLIEKFPPYRVVDFELVMAVLSGQGLDLLHKQVNLEFLIGLAFYFLTIFLAAFVVGALARGFMVITNADRLNITERLRFTSDFAYLAQGRDFTNKSSKSSFWQRFKQNSRVSDSQYVGVEIFTEIAGRLAYYTGILSRVDYKNAGEPSRLYITGAMVTEVESLEDLAKPLPAVEQTSNYYVFKTADIKVIGFYYFNDEAKLKDT